jgi:hypothetical protein
MVRTGKNFTFTLPFCSFLGAFRKIAKSGYDFCHVSLSVCPSVRMEELGFH